MYFKGAVVEVDKNLRGRWPLLTKNEDQTPEGL